jgi:hypothetical protein
VILIIAFLVWRCYRKRKQTAIANNAAILVSAIESSRGLLGGPVYEKTPEAVSTGTFPTSPSISLFSRFLCPPASKTS